MLKLIFFIGFCSTSCIASIAQTDYSILQYWAAHPLKKDPSDQIPKSILKSYQQDTLVDIFFIHPTTYTQSTKPFGLNASVDDEELNVKTDNSTILYQASIFNSVGFVYAPRYQQAHYSNYFPKTNEDSLNAIQAFEVAYADVKNAFEYYLKNHNHGKPIIIAAHSQGTTHAKRLLKEFFDNELLQQQLVAAYLVGMPVEWNWFKYIKPCTKPNAVGCFCSWRTFKENYKPDYVLNETDSMIVTNPITWDVEKPFANRKENPGTILRNFNKVKKGIVDARVEQNILWCKKPKFFGNIFLTTKNYHIADYNFYYLSIRQNAKTRVENYFKNRNVSN
ncbi:MAG: DUF3089 domain-containing protein [Chitinophagaceae bacterium]|nr:DUF3089 domain-containing protein [Chitinophagaceae bacterium]